MKKVFSILLFIPFLISCKTNEDKIQDLIREHMFQTLYDYKSYEPIETTDLKEEVHSLENDSTIITFVKEYTKGEEKIGDLSLEQRYELQEVLDDVLERREEFLNITNQLDKSYGYSVIHKFRAKNKGGVYDIYTKKYLIDKNLTRIIWEYTINENNKVGSNLAYIIESWNNSKHWKRENIEFLEINKKKPGVITTKSGLQYKIIEQGKGAIPTEKSKVRVNYTGTLINGEEFDSSYKRGVPAIFRVDMVIKGWTETLVMMPVGSKWEIYVPQKLGYGSRYNGNIKSYSTLIFEIELLGIEK